VLALSAWQRPFGRATTPCLVVAYRLVANDFMAVVARQHGVMSALLQGYLLAGALLLLVVLYAFVMTVADAPPVERKRGPLTEPSSHSVTPAAASRDRALSPSGDVAEREDARAEQREVAGS
jgi:hypothetical protein